MISRSTDGKQRILSLSYGKDSMACLGAMEELGWPLDRIITVDVWATDDIPADLPEMVAFKEYADKVILERYGIEVEHLCAQDKNGNKLTYEKLFYHVPKRKPKNAHLTGIGGGRTQLRMAQNNRPVVQEDQIRACTDFPSNGIPGARNSSQRRCGFQRVGGGAEPTRLSKEGLILGFPIVKGQWCNSDLKRSVFQERP